MLSTEPSGVTHYRNAGGVTHHARHPVNVAILRMAWWSTAGQDTRRWAFYHLGAQMRRQDTGDIHGPETRSGWHYANSTERYGYELSCLGDIRAALS